MTRVLVVDDDSIFRTTLGRDLGSHGFSVFLAEDANRAASVLAEHAIDVLLTDLRMPCADGIDLLDRARTLSPRTRSILMSGFATARDYHRAIEYGAVRVLCKPFTPEELLQTIQLAVDCETGFRGSIHGLSLIDLLQMFHFSRRSVAIVVDGSRSAQICLEDGRIVHARCGDRIGEPALHAVLAMGAGSVRTTVLPAEMPRTIVRDFEPLLLDVLRTLDEHGRGPPTSDLPIAFEEPSIEGASSPDIESFTDRLRAIEGYASAFLIDGASGAVLSFDGAVGGIDVQRAAHGYAELYQAEQSTIQALAIDDRLESVLITLAGQYHVLYAVAGHPTLFVCAVIERKNSNLGMIRLALARMENRIAQERGTPR